VVPAGGYPDPRRAWPISVRRDDLRLGVGRVSVSPWRRLLLHHLIPGSTDPKVMWDGDVRLAMRARIITAPLASGFGLTAYGNSGSQLTLCWSGMDSNFQFRARMCNAFKA